MAVYTSELNWQAATSSSECVSFFTAVGMTPKLQTQKHSHISDTLKNIHVIIHGKKKISA